MILTYPLITISSRLQVQNNNYNEDAYKSTLDALVKILRTEGVPGLYSGLGSALFGISVTNGVYYYFYEWVKATFESAKKTKRPMSAAESMAAGAIAGAAVVFVTHPIWTVNTRVTTTKKAVSTITASSSRGPSILPTPKARPAGTIATIMQIFREDGPTGFFRGIVPALILVMNPIIQYTVFEQVKQRIAKVKRLSNLDFFLLGAVSKLAATGITYPYIVIKSRMQLKQDSVKGRYSSVLDGFRKIVAAEGFEGLYKGISSKLTQSVLTASFLFMAKEALFKWAITVLILVGARSEGRNFRYA
jgi:adenine nucleotide transporter 17